MKPNPDEVQAIKYVTLPELQAMMQPSTGLLWSPWFRIIVENFLVHWWADLNTTLSTDKYVDVNSVYKFDPSAEHMGGAGNAGSWLGKAVSPYATSTFGSTKRESVTALVKNGDKGLKQGGYGKVKIHKHSIVEQLSHLGEVAAALQVLYGNSLENKLVVTDENVRFCDDILVKVSRSFAQVIKQLPSGLCVDIMVFYLALRALDTIEDDMEAFKNNNNVKIEKLLNFYKLLGDENWSMDGVGEGDEARLLQEYYRCSKV